MKLLKRNELGKTNPRGLFVSKSYGLGKEKFWSLARKKYVRDLGYTPPHQVHTHLYEHEKDLGDVFVSLALTKRLYNWQGEGDQKRGLREDRLFQFDDLVFYLERERGTQGREKLRRKLSQYVTFYRETKEPFYVLILGEDTELYLSLFQEMQLGSYYRVAVFSAFVNDPLNTPLRSNNNVQNIVQLAEE